MTKAIRNPCSDRVFIPLRVTCKPWVPRHMLSSRTPCSLCSVAVQRGRHLCQQLSLLCDSYGACLQTYKRKLTPVYHFIGISMWFIMYLLYKVKYFDKLLLFLDYNLSRCSNNAYTSNHTMISYNLIWSRTQTIQKSDGGVRSWVWELIRWMSRKKKRKIEIRIGNFRIGAGGTVSSVPPPPPSPHFLKNESVLIFFFFTYLVAKVKVTPENSPAAFASLHVLPPSLLCCTTSPGNTLLLDNFFFVTLK